MDYKDYYLKPLFHWYTCNYGPAEAPQCKVIKYVECKFYYKDKCKELDTICNEIMNEIKPDKHWMIDLLKKTKRVFDKVSEILSGGWGNENLFRIVEKKLGDEFSSKSHVETLCALVCDKHRAELYEWRKVTTKEILEDMRNEFSYLEDQKLLEVVLESLKEMIWIKQLIDGEPKSDNLLMEW